MMPLIFTNTRTALTPLSCCTAHYLSFHAVAMLLLHCLSPSHCGQIHHVKHPHLPRHHPVTQAATEGVLRKTHPIELSIDSGSIRGEYLTIGESDFAVFKGIPYAAPPVGALRFQPPEPPARWRGVMNATQYAPMCAQRPRTRATDPVESYKMHASEDCLYLNIFAPPQFTNETYPLIVFIHGGGFQAGSSSDYSQEAILKNFVSRRVIFVSMNYRLGPLGFLSTGDEVVPGNNGLWDIIFALRWVQLNAHVFGGDPQQVLLMGHGSGAAAASLLALSPRAEGLFEKAMLMSGTAISPGVVRISAVNATWAQDRRLHCRSFNSSELLECFRKQLRDEILDFAEDTNPNYNLFVPVVDGERGIIPNMPETLASYRKKIPLMLGTTRDESALKLLLINENPVLANFSAIGAPLAEQLVENITEASGFVNNPLIREGCKHEYVWRVLDPSRSNEPILFESILKMHSHFWHDAPASRLASYYVLQEVPVYLYSFDHVSENFETTTDRVFHGCDEIFLLGVEPRCQRLELRFLATRRDRNWQLDRKVTELFADLIINFLKYGHPTPNISATTSAYAFNWTSTTSDRLEYLSITDNPALKVGYRWQGHAFWNKYAKHLDSVDVGNLQKIARLDRQLGNFQLATWTLLFCALFFFAILVGLACYCTRKEADEEEL